MSRLYYCSYAGHMEYPLMTDPALSKVYDVPNSIITNGGDRWCRHFIERRYFCPRSPYETNRRNDACTHSSPKVEANSPSGDQDGFVYPLFG